MIDRREAVQEKRRSRHQDAQTSVGDKPPPRLSPDLLISQDLSENNRARRNGCRIEDPHHGMLDDSVDRIVPCWGPFRDSLGNIRSVRNWAWTRYEIIFEIGFM